MELLEERAREKAGMGDDWSLYALKCVPEHPQKTEFVEATGAVAPIKTRGKGAGNHDWKKMDKTTKRTVYLALNDHAEWVKAWELKTGLCAKCKGEGQEFAGWSVTDGVRKRPCSKCAATGKSNDSALAQPDDHNKPSNT